MRFIVDFYRYVIFAGIALMIIGTVFVSLLLLDSEGPPEFSMMMFLGGALAIVVFVMSLGITATFISIHDRHVELVEALQEIRDTLWSSQERGE